MELNPINPYDWEFTGWAYRNADPILPNLRYSENTIAAILYLRGLHRRVNVIGKSLIIQIDGEHQTGKSSSGGYLLCYLLDPTFSANRRDRICTTAREILQAVQKIKESEIKGAAIMIDEGGAAAGRQDYHEKIQKAIDKTIQIIGNLRIIIVVISPVKQQISSSLERMAHKYIHFARYGKEYTNAYPYNIHYNSIAKQIITPKPVVVIFGNRYILKRIKISRLPKWLDDQYREIENEKKPLLLRKLAEDGLKEEIEEKKQDPLELVPIVVEKYKRFLTKIQRRRGNYGIAVKLDPRLISRGMGITFADAEYILADCEELLNKPEEIEKRRKEGVKNDRR